MTQLCPIEIDTLRAAAGEDVPGFQWGAAVGASLEYLAGAGLVTRGPRFVATQKGRDLLGGLHRPAP